MTWHFVLSTQSRLYTCKKSITFSIYSYVISKGLNLRFSTVYFIFNLIYLSCVKSTFASLIIPFLGFQLISEITLDAIYCTLMGFRTVQLIIVNMIFVQSTNVKAIVKAALNLHNWAREKYFLCSDLKARVGFEPTFPTFQAITFNHCTGARLSFCQRLGMW